jgi:pimeloyl-ACP methyl ester carboxylesterase
MHHLIDIDHFAGSYGLMAAVQPRIALVFVHGFAGDSVDTWSEFQPLVDRPPFEQGFEEADLFFWDYPCTRQTIAESASSLNRFLAEGLKRRDRYAVVRLIGHSTGAVVIRQLLLDLARGATASKHASLLLASQPLLFSSAHFGFRQALAVTLLAHGIPAMAALTALWQLFRGRVYADLDPASPVLQQLERQTVRRVRRHHEDNLRALLYWGARDNVVNTVDYDVDVRVAFEADCDHRSVCKPSATNARPIEWVLNAIR